jgi:hypothetical protein
MRPVILITICTLCFGAFAGCTLLKQNGESSSSNSPSPVERSRTASTPLTTNTTPAANDHPDDIAAGGATQNDDLHTPAKGTEERQAIMDALRGNQQVVFQVNYLKVHNGWCWVDTTPLDKSGRATAEGGPNLLHLENGAWKVKDLSRVPDDAADPLGPEDASPTYIRNVMKTFPGVPRDIFPKAGK